MRIVLVGDRHTRGLMGFKKLIGGNKRSSGGWHVASSSSFAVGCARAPAAVLREENLRRKLICVSCEARRRTGGMSYPCPGANLAQAPVVDGTELRREADLGSPSSDRRHQMTPPPTRARPCLSTRPWSSRRSSRPGERLSSSTLGLLVRKQPGYVPPPRSRRGWWPPRLWQGRIRSRITPYRSADRLPTRAHLRPAAWP